MAIDYRKREQTLTYIQEELDRGIDPQMILHVLFEAKYPYDFISKTITYLPEKKFEIMHKALINKQSVYYEDEVIKMRDLISKGCSKEEVKDELVKKGYTPSAIKDILKKTQKNFFVETLNYLGKILLVILFLIFILMLGFVTNSNLFSVFVGFSPSLLTIIFLIYLLEGKRAGNVKIIWVFPLFFVMMFYVFLSQTNVAALQGLNVGELAAFNLIISYFFVFILGFLGVLNREYITRITHFKEHHDKDEIFSKNARRELKEKEEIREFVTSVEDKCKAINFVIGRVYSNKHGGSAALREKIKINKELYNEFSRIEKFELAPDLKKILSVVRKLRSNLKNLTKPEKEVFTDSELKKIKLLIRNKDGSDRIIDLLKFNDKDPVETYFENAFTFCNELVEKLPNLIKKEQKKE